MKFVSVSPFASAYARPTTSVVDQFFNRNLNAFVGSDSGVSHPSVNVLENEQAFVVEIAAPGLQKDDFKVNVEKDQLIVSVQKEVKKEEGKEGDKYVRREFSYNSFRRSFTLPENVGADNIHAAYENGVLKVTLPKEVVKNNVKTIEIA